MKNYTYRWISFQKKRKTIVLLVVDQKRWNFIVSLFETLETEMQGHWQRSKQVLATGEKLLLVVPPNAKEEVQGRIGSLQENWDKLRQILSVLGRWLKEAQQAQQYFQVSRFRNKVQ